MGYCKPNQMEKWIDQWGNDLIGGYRKSTELNIAPCNLMLCWGMGGSGIGGRIIADITNHQGKKPVIASGGYRLPCWVNRNVLFVSVSYSGNTEETINAFEQAIKTGAKVVVLTSGGQLKKFADQYQLEQLQLQGGRAPRANIGEILGALMGIAEKAHIIDIDYTYIQKLTEEINTSLDQQFKSLDQITPLTEHKNIYIVVPEKFSGVGLRWVTQLNENAKIPAQTLILPEMNHNFIVGRITQPSLFILVSAEQFETRRELKRKSVTRKVLLQESKNIQVEELKISGSDFISTYIHMLVWGDIFSIKMAEKLDEDPLPIEMIDKLKMMMKGEG
ncbi:MAG: hypothetical protein APR63_03215 [Desulfuromonas sp. SDB]|nr:MAG: hypothetical protein APR63_03215 [Desulfuromonas sp. SDB]